MMPKFLIVDDEPTNSLLLKKYLEKYGECDLAENGQEAIDAVRHSFDVCDPYDLICLDIMMPIIDGNDTLKEIRTIEEESAQSDLSTKVSKIVMVTALSDIKTVFESYNNLCDGYLTKPITKDKFIETLTKLEIIPS
jgi:two-component system chemotaxis response regulator CheY